MDDAILIDDTWWDEVLQQFDNLWEDVPILDDTLWDVPLADDEEWGNVPTWG